MGVGFRDCGIVGGNWILVFWGFVGGSWIVALDTPIGVRYTGKHMNLNEVHHKDASEALSKMEDNSVTGVVTDPPYGLSDHSNIAEILQSWLSDSETVVKGSGFMGREWDAMVPPPRIWKEVLRVLKPGGFAFVFAGTRSMDLMAMSLRLAGFEIKDTLAWHYGSGFPKSMNIGKALDKQAGAERGVIGRYRRPDGSNPRNNVKATKFSGRAYNGGIASGDGNDGYLTAPATDAAKQFDGYGTALKPSFEPILVTMKPVEGTYANNALTHGVAGLNIDAGRIGTSKSVPASPSRNAGSQVFGKYAPKTGEESGYNPNMGRWPANTILTHHPECEYVGEKEVKNRSGSVSGSELSVPAKDVYGEYGRKAWQRHGDENGNETVEDWKCHPECPVHLLDLQAGDKSSARKSGNLNDPKRGGNTTPLWGMSDGRATIDYRDSGGPSRFFYTSKASKRERNYGCDNLLWKRDKDSYTGITAISRNEWEKLSEKERSHGNVHPTVKPVSIMRWLIKLLTMPENTTILDPFAGSGTTGVAAALEGVDFIGFDLGMEYCDIANARMEYARTNPTAFDTVKPKKKAKTIREENPEDVEDEEPVSDIIDILTE